MNKRLLTVAWLLLFCGTMTMVWAQNFPTWESKDYDPGDGKDTVKWNNYIGIDLLWVNKWWTTAVDTPGCLMDSGGTSGWQVINSKAVCTGTGSYQWNGCDEAPASDAQVGIPTWMDGAKGAYTMTHDDFGAMSTSYLEQSWKIAKEVNDANRDYFGGYNPIRLGFGIQVDECTDGDWTIMRDVMKQGHEALCHSYDHTSAAHQWLWYYQCDTTGAALDEIHSFTLAYGDTIPTDPDVKTIPEWAKGAIVLNSEYASAPGTETDHFGYKVKTDGNTKYIKCNKMAWIDQCQVGACIVNCAARDDGLQTHYDGWNDTERDLNVNKANDTININTYDILIANGQLESKYNPPDKKCEYYCYPYDAYSIQTHQYLDDNGFVSARGGGKCSLTTPADFFHPYLTYFDSYYSDDLGEFPDNPHQWLSTTHMLDFIVRDCGYMIRELHAVTESDYWGKIEPDRYRNHLNDVITRMKNGDLTVVTPSQAVKQSMVSNVTTVTISATGNENEWIITPTVGSLQNSDKYDNELISYIVTLPSSVDDASWVGMASYYTSDDTPVRRAPRKLKRRNAQKKWAVYANPFKGDVKIIGNMTNILYEFGKAHGNTIKLISFANGKMLLFAKKGSFEATLFSPSGRAVAKTAGKANGGFVKAYMNVDRLGNGCYILSVKHRDGLLRQRVILAR